MQLIVAVDEGWGIGNRGELLFSIPDDLHRFKELTWGKKIVFGRATLATFPYGKPLPGRVNYLLTHNDGDIPLGCVGVTAADRLENDCIVVGGESVYRALLHRCDVAHVTKIHARAEADRHFPNLDDAPDWQLVRQGETRQHNGVSYCFCRYERIRKE